jgi:hypothetical protein
MAEFVDEHDDRDHSQEGECVDERRAPRRDDHFEHL